MEEYTRKPNTQCAICKKAIYRRPSEIKMRNNRVFCSQNCYGVACRKEVPCIVCGKPILSGLHKKTCSRSCANKNRAGIKYKLNRPKDKVKDLRALKSKLLRDRGSVCEQCGYAKMPILQIHHVDRDRKNNSLKNLKLLCPNCHMETHYLENDVNAGNM